MKRNERAQKNGRVEKVRTIVGYVTEFDFDDDSTGISILTEDGDDFIVNLDGAGKKLLDYMDEEVMVTGVVNKDAYGDDMITVKDFEMVEFDDEQSDNDDDFMGYYADYDTDLDLPEDRFH